jgi:hypothetical protein
MATNCIHSWHDGLPQVNLIRGTLKYRPGQVCSDLWVLLLQSSKSSLSCHISNKNYGFGARSVVHTYNFQNSGGS